MTPEAVGALIAAGRLDEALAAARQLAGFDPGNAASIHLLAVAQNAAGARDEALATLDRALQIAPGEAAVWNTRGAVQIDRGELADAERGLREALRLKADYLEARFNLALLLRRRGELGAAADELARIQASRPDFAPAQLESATLHIEMGQPQAALPALLSLDRAYPRNQHVLVNLAAALQKLERNEEAAAQCRLALQLPGVDARAIAAIAQTLAAAGLEEEAAAAARRAASMGASLADVRVLAADALAATGHAREARDHYAFALRTRRDPAVLAKMGYACLASGDAAAAAAALEEQLLLQPGARAASLNLAIALDDLGRRGDAKQVLLRAAERGLRDAQLLGALAVYKAKDCDWPGLDALVAELREAARTPGPHPAFPRHAMFFEEVSASEQRAWAENWTRVAWPRSKPRPRRQRHAGRTRIGYLSSDFNDHPVAHLAVGLFENHDHGRFETIAYSAGRDDGSSVRARLAKAFDRFVEIGPLTDHAAAERIRADRLDVLVDLGGLAKDARFAVLSHRPAPAQVHFLGYPGTTGAPFVDYYVADGYTVPPRLESFFTETVLRMPDCFLPGDAKRPISPRPSRAACGLPDDALVLCSFNQAMKITRRIFDRWCDLLAAIPHAVLWLSWPGDEARLNLLAHARARGVDPARIHFAQRIQAIDEHLARLGNADLALDTFPYGSHTTASDALWTGVPLVALRGDAFASRVSGSVVTAAGCGDLAFDDADQAFAATLALARDARALAEMRARVELARGRSPLFDSARQARAFESLLEEAVERTPAP